MGLFDSFCNWKSLSLFPKYLDQVLSIGSGIDFTEIYSILQ